MGDWCQEKVAIIQPDKMQNRLFCTGNVNFLFVEHLLKCVFEGAASVANWQEMCERNANGIKRGKMYFVRSDIYSSHKPNKSVGNLLTISKTAVSITCKNTCSKLQPRQTVPFLSKQTPILCDRCKLWELPTQKMY